jgi:uncharacterized protein YndB with AHSA1/START domain
MTEGSGSSRRVQVSRVIAAPRAAIFAVVTDPAMHPVIDGSGTVRSAGRGAVERLGPGSRFGMDMHMGAPYRVSNRVVEFEQDRRIAWHNLNRIRWRYELADADGGTLVTESFDWSQALGGRLWELTPFPGRARRGMEATLERLAALVTGATPA